MNTAIDKSQRRKAIMEKVRLPGIEIISTNAVMSIEVNRKGIQIITNNGGALRLPMEDCSLHSFAAKLNQIHGVKASVMFAQRNRSARLLVPVELQEVQCGVRALLDIEVRQMKDCVENYNEIVDPEDYDGYVQFRPKTEEELIASRCPCSFPHPSHGQCDGNPLGHLIPEAK